MTLTVFQVQMNCTGCSGACTRILKKFDGVEQIDANLESQRISVTHDAKVSPQDMLVALKKWGDAGKKTVELESSL